MNIQEFENFYYRLFKSNTRLIKQADNINITVDESGNKTAINAWKDNKNIGYINFDILNDKNMIKFNLILIQEEYKNTSLAMKLFKEFYKLYKDKYSGYQIKADFYNEDLYKMYKRFEDKGYFPKSDAAKFNSRMEDKDKFNTWKQNEDNRSFGMNRDENFELLPKPYKKFDNVNQNNYFDDDVIYKNLADNDINILNEFASKYSDGQKISILMFSNSDKYYAFCSSNYNEYQSKYESMNIQCFVQKYNNIVRALSLDIAKSYVQDIINFIGNTKITLEIIDNISNASTIKKYNLNSVDEINNLSDNESTIAKRLKS